MVVFFVLLLVIVQSGFLVVSRSLVGASVDAAVRRLAADPAAVIEERLADEIVATVPGAIVESLESDWSDLVARVTVRYRWTPPGPDLVPITMTIERRHAVVVAP